MPFHRLTAPSYFGGLPGGYDYINNLLAGTPAPADTAKVGGPNAGTYFVAFGEDATSADFNRPSSALAQNTDFIDDLLRRDLASPVQTNDVVAGGAGVSSILLTGPGIFVGEAGTPNTVAGIRTFVRVLDENDNEIFDSTGAECQITSLTSATPGTGFSAGNVTLNISPSIPNGKTYRVYYWVRSNLATYTSGFLQKARPNNSLTVRYMDRIRTLTASGTLHSPVRDGTVILNPAMPFNLQLPSPGPWAGVKVRLLNGTNVMGPGNAVTIVRAGAELINNVAANYTLNIPGGGWELVSDGTNWQIRQFLTDFGVTSTVTTNTNLASTSKDNTVNLNSTGGAFNLQLPNPSLTLPGQFWNLKDIVGMLGTNAVTLVRFGAEQIEGLAASYVLNASWGAWTIYTNGTNWFIR